MSDIIKPFISYDQLFSRYGNPEKDPIGFEEKWIVRYPHTIANGQQIIVAANRDIVPELHAVWARLILDGSLDLVKSYDGAFVIRDIRASTNISLHAFGLAIDINAEENQLGTEGNMPYQIREAFEAQGFFWGGNFKHRKDPMHFEFTTGLI